MLSDLLRKKISKYFTGNEQILFRNSIPENSVIEENIKNIEELGVYLHIPFCDQICPYCPYNKEIFSEEASRNYTNALKKEIDFYAPLLSDKPITNMYIGGGTPTTMLGNGIEEIINHLYKRFNMQCRVHMESHPNHLTKENLNAIEALGVKYLSIGVEALQDRHLKAIERPYTVLEVKRNVERAAGRNFECVNIDYIFDLPGQTIKEVEEAGREMVKLGIQQVATYPLFRFPYTRLGREAQNNGTAIGTMFRRRKLLKILENIFYDSGFDRSSVWAFTKSGIDKYCSVTVPSYLGLGASGSSYLKDTFYVNTFNVSEYIQAIEKGKSPIALSVDLHEEMQMAGWLYWRIYETKFKKSDFNYRFNASFDEKYGRQMRMLNRIGFLKNGEDQITLSDKGTYWIHAFEDFFSIDYINKLWGTSKFNPWPEKVVL
ncbi:MAG: radical SAM protein [Bacteroidetes bacterium]|jgi:coproporphyrinogen III oxidase-like Fe-S oxidoreductase|nr:radical SAM protein [Bacteroidota bacterium]MBT6685143.1 radical SAM protein [Bacteroidota bacterium]MBT7493376.1 radical SAM protein [Bacteroidota bacterium]